MQALLCLNKKIYILFIFHGCNKLLYIFLAVRAKLKGNTYAEFQGK